jgi:hypothetical protein
MTLALSYDTLLVPAGTAATPGMIRSPKGGKFLYLRSTTQPVIVSFDSGNPFQMEGGFNVSEPFSSVTFFNPTASAITVVFYIGTAGIDYVGTDSVKAAPNYALGNTGLTYALNPTLVTSRGFIQLSKANFPTGLLVGNTNNGHRRFQISFTLWGGSGTNNFLQISDANGNPFDMIFNQSGSSFTHTYQTDAQFLLQTDLSAWNSGGVALIQVGELYYAN